MSYPQSSPTRYAYLSVRLPAPLAQQLAAAAARENNHVSSVVRRVLTEALRVDAGEAVSQ